MALVPAYLVGQIAGCLLGGLAIWGIAQGGAGDFDAAPANFAANLYGNENGFFSLGATAVAEIIFTGLLVFTVLATTSKKFAAGQVGLTVGMVLGLIHLISIPIDNTSVNPVRSLGMAVFAGGDALSQLWVFIVFPLIGAIAGVAAWLAVDDQSLSDTALSDVDLRDAAARATAATRGAGERVR